MLYWVFKAIFLVILKIFYRVKLEGLENLPKRTNFILVSNHASWLDSLFFVAFLPKKIYGIAARYLYRFAFLRWFLKAIDAIPTRNSSEKSISLLKNNKIIGLFPEGGCTRDGKLRKFRKGAAFLALKTGIPLVPCAILGTYQAYPIKARFPKLFMPISIKFGKPICLLKEFDHIIDDVSLQDGTAKIKNSIMEIINAG